jgi:hypothetical protein
MQTDYVGPDGFILDLKTVACALPGAAASGANKTQQEIAAACKGARPNHVGVVIARHKRAGRIEERDGKLYATQSTEQTRPSAA